MSQELLEIYRDMVFLRVFDEEWKRFSHMGRVGNVPLTWGLEAVYAGSMRALEAEDWVFPSYRETSASILRGVPAATVLAMERGHPGGWWDPWSHNVAPPSIPVGSHVSHAVGYAWGTRLAGLPHCTIVYFGDGATSEGAFHEGANYAALTKAPVVLMCNNNGWAISTPVSRQSAAATLAAKAEGYGMPGVRVDGHDVLAVRDATAEALARARDGGGPTLIEAVTVRTGAHAAVDDPSLYMDQEAVERERSKDCLARYEQELQDRDLLDEDTRQRYHDEARSITRTAMQEAEALEDPLPGAILGSVYAEPAATIESSGQAFQEERR